MLATTDLLDELIERTHQMFLDLDELSWVEKKYNLDTCLLFEKMSWMALDLKRNLKNIKENL